MPNTYIIRMKRANSKKGFTLIEKDITNILGSLIFYLFHNLSFRMFGIMIIKHLYNRL